MTTIAFTIPGPPVGKGRPRLGKGHVYTPAKTAAYEAKVKALALVARQQAKQRVWPGPVCVKIVVWATGKRTGRPDLDNVCKGILDSCNGIIYKDDAQLVGIDIVRFGNMEGPNCRVTFTLLDE